jgi:hypothetical protein
MRDMDEDEYVGDQMHKNIALIVKEKGFDKQIQKEAQEYFLSGGRPYSFPKELEDIWPSIEKEALARIPKKELVAPELERLKEINTKLATIAFSFQIYCDFSGYSDIAIGTAKLFGFELLTNFKFPYFSNSIKEFWKRWHISLSSWFRDYIFIPLGGSRKTKLLTIRNILIIFLVSGLWHGASWNFLIWGFLHAILYIIFYFRKRKVESDLKIIKFLRIILTFLSVNFLWVFFRFSSLKGALNLFYFMINDWYKNPLQFFHLPEQGGIIMIYVLPIIIVDYYFRNNERKLRVPNNLFFRYPIYIIISMVIIYFYAYNKGQQFIYFEF